MDDDVSATEQLQSKSKRSHQVLSIYFIYREIFLHMQCKKKKQENNATLYEIKKKLMYISLAMTVFVWFLLPFLFQSFNKISFRLNDIVLRYRLIEKIPFSDENAQTIQNLVSMFDNINIYPKEEILPGIIFRDAGIRAKYPIMITPGITTTSLDEWHEHSDAYSNTFKQKVWGSLQTLLLVITDKHEWIKKMKLNEKTGLDIHGIKVRAGKSFEAVDFLFPGFWLWGKIFENLTKIGYDESNIEIGSFDWRLGISDLEKRDKYFTKQCLMIEMMRKTNGRPVVLIGHSFGGLVNMYLLKWIEVNIGAHWIEENVHRVVNINTPYLGAPKALASIMTGENGENVKYSTIFSIFCQLFFKNSEMCELYRTWGSFMTLLPKGGNAIWGEKDFSPEGLENTHFVSVDDEKYYADNLPRLFQKYLSKETRTLIEKHCSFSNTLPSDRLHECWTNPFEYRLPSAKGLVVYSFYGVGLETERGYEYRTVDNTLKLASGGKSAINLCDGDGTVPLVSLGYIPYKHWRKPEVNGGNVLSVVREYQHNPVSMIRNLRRGPESSDHVDILGNKLLMTDLIKIVAGICDLDDKILSSIETLSDRIEKIKQNTDASAEI